jgi:hypothetical protein
MAEPAGIFASALRQELMARNRSYALGRPHAQSYGSAPVIVYAPEDRRHGNFFDAAYAAILGRPEWLRRFDKVHAQARRSLPKTDRRWRELDSSMSSDALLMNIFCTPGVADSPSLTNALGVDLAAQPLFGWRARVPFQSGRFDRTEVDMRLGSLLVEAKLTETDFQTCLPAAVEAYRDFDQVFDRDRLPRTGIVTGRRKESTEFPEDYSQEYEEPADPTSLIVIERPLIAQFDSGYASYQLIRNVLAAHAEGCSFCVLHDARRPDLREAWFQVMAAVRSAALRVRLKVLTWQELAALLPSDLQDFLDIKYGIVPPGQTPSVPSPQPLAPSPLVP